MGALHSKESLVQTTVLLEEKFLGWPVTEGQLIAVSASKNCTQQLKVDCKMDHAEPLCCGLPLGNLAHWEVAGTDPSTPWLDDGYMGWPNDSNGIVANLTRHN